MTKQKRPQAQCKVINLSRTHGKYGNEHSYFTSVNAMSNALSPIDKPQATDSFSRSRTPWVRLTGRRPASNILIGSFQVIQKVTELYTRVRYTEAAQRVAPEKLGTHSPPNKRTWLVCDERLTQIQFRYVQLSALWLGNLLFLKLIQFMIGFENFGISKNHYQLLFSRR